MTDIKTFFTDAGWLANFFSIAMPIVTIVSLIWGGLSLFGRKLTIRYVLSADTERKWSSDKAKQIARIAFVDDQPGDFPISDLKRDGFDITVFRQIQLSDIGTLSKFDVVFLDMKGIVKDDPEYGGLKLIAELRRLSPKQKICAVSSKTFDPTATEFFKQADDLKRKPMTAQECKAVIDNFVGDMLNLPILSAAATAILKGKSRKTRRKVLDAMKKFDSSSSGRDKFEDCLTEVGFSQEDRFPLVNLYRIIHA